MKSTPPPDPTATLLTKRGLRDALGLASTRIIDSWVRRRMISSYRLGHRTLLFNLDRVREDLARFEVRAVGREKK